MVAGTPALVEAGLLTPAAIATVAVYLPHCGPANRPLRRLAALALVLNGTGHLALAGVLAGWAPNALTPAVAPVCAGTVLTAVLALQALWERRMR